GVMLTPAVVLDGKVVSSGKVPTVQELVELLKKNSPT
ncbi:MAG: thioredoxin family protein, partial [Thermodesulfovibrionales bacterium]|nr:thioredoxin family protein [Thermodesulfovibrionales bacterium]